MHWLRSSLFLGAWLLSAMAAAQPSLAEADRLFTAPGMGETRAVLVNSFAEQAQ